MTREKKGKKGTEEKEESHTIRSILKRIWAEPLIRFTVIYCAIGVGIIVFFNTVLMLNYIPSASMEDTLMVHDIILANRLFDKVERYDIVVFYSPDNPDELMIKRVIGLPGETIVVADGNVYADGVELDESFIREPMEPYGDGIFEVPEDCYFMMGDNRNNSLDSRFWRNKYVPYDNIVSVATCRLFPFTKIGSVQYEDMIQKTASEDEGSGQ